MRFTRRDLDWAVGEGLIGAAEAERLWRGLEARAEASPRFDAAHVAYYAGALLVIGAMGWFMSAAWEELGGGGIFTIAAVYMVAFWALGRRLWHRPGGQVSGGLMVAVAVAITPLAVYGLQRWLGLWQGNDPGSYRDFHVWIRSGWFTMELATVVVGLLAVRVVPFGFVTAPIAFALWYMSMDLTPIIAGADDFEWELRKAVSLWFGLAMLATSYVVDRRWLGGPGRDFAFLGYLFGLIAFWGGLKMMDSDSELAKFGYFLVNAGLILAAVFLRRRAFLVFGPLGCFGYLGYLAYDLFEDSALFPVTVTVTVAGVLVIALRMALRRYGPGWEAAIVAAMPEGLRRLRPEER
jgi:hypothetical protein